METNKQSMLQLRWLCRKYKGIEAEDISSYLKNQDKIRELAIANLPEGQGDYGKYSTANRVEFIQKVLDLLFSASSDRNKSIVHLKGAELPRNLNLIKITRAVADIVHALIVLKKYAMSREIESGLNLPQKVISNCETEPDAVKSLKTGQTNDHYSEVRDRSFKSGYWMHSLNLQSGKILKEKDAIIGKNQAPRDQDYAGPSDEIKNTSSECFQIEKVAQDYLNKVTEINENGIRKIKLNTWKKFFCFNEENECISAFNAQKEKTYRFEFEDGFFGYSEAKKIIQEEFGFLHDQSSDQNTFFREENITAIYHNRRDPERTDNKIQLALGFSKSKGENKRFVECAFVGRKESNKMEAYSNLVEVEFQKLEMDQGGVYGNCGYEGLLSYEEFEQKNLILGMIKNQLAVGDVKLAWGLETSGVYSDNLGTYDWIECKYNPQMTVLDHPLQKDGEDSCLHCAFIIIALHFKRELYSGIIKPNTNLNIFLKRIKLRKSVSLQPSRLKKYNQRMEKEGKIVSLLGLSDENNKRKHAVIAIDTEEEDQIQIWHGWSKFPELINKPLLRGNIFLTNPQGMVHEFTIASIDIISEQDSSVKSRGPKQKSHNYIRILKKFK